MLTLVKAIKGQCEELKQRDRAFNDLFFTAVSKVRQSTGVFLQLAKRKYKYSKSDESKIYQQAINPHFWKINNRILVSYILNLDSHDK